MTRMKGKEAKERKRREGLATREEINNLTAAAQREAYTNIIFPIRVTERWARN